MSDRYRRWAIAAIVVSASMLSGAGAKAQDFLGILTGGTSGVPLKVYQDLSHCCMIEEAFSLRQRLWTDYKQYDRKVTLTRDPHNRVQKCWDYNNLENEIILSSFDMTEKNMFTYVDVMHKFSLSIMVGYPSALEIFARYRPTKNTRTTC